jgi:uncharacterized protein YkwD
VESTTAPDLLRQAVVTLTNEERRKAGLPALRYNATLEIAAQRHAQDMLVREYFSHETPEGLSSRDRIERAGYGLLTIETCGCRSFRVAFGENIGKGQATAEKVVNDWMNSPDHRDNILFEGYEEIGIGIYGDMWVQNFGGITVRY